MEGESGGHTESTKAVERAEALPGVEHVERPLEEEKADLLLHMEDGSRLHVPTQVLISAQEMNNHTLISQLQDKYGEGQ